MEKYSKWRDPATGIHPFLIAKNGEQNCNWGTLLFRLLLAVARVAMGAALLLLHAAVQALLVCAPDGIRNCFARHVYRSAGLLVFGLWIPGCDHPFRSGKKAIFSPHVSPIDRLVWSCYCSDASFTSVKNLEDCRSLLGFTAQGKTKILFPEGCTTNGRVILSFEEGFQVDSPVYVASVTFPRAFVPFIGGSRFWYLLRTIFWGEIFAMVTIKVSQVGNGGTISSQAIGQAMSSLSGKRQIQQTKSDQDAFLAYFYATSKST